MERPSFSEYANSDKTLSDFLNDYLDYAASNGNEEAAKFDRSLLASLDSGDADSLADWLAHEDNQATMSTLRNILPDLTTDVMETSTDDDSYTELAMLEKLRFKQATDTLTERTLLSASLRDKPETRDYAHHKIRRNLKAAAYTAVQMGKRDFVHAMITAAKDSLDKLESHFDELPPDAQEMKQWLRSTESMLKILDLPSEQFIQLHNRLVDLMCSDMSNDDDIHVVYRHYLTPDEDEPPVHGLVAILYDGSSNTVAPIAFTYHPLFEDEISEGFNDALEYKRSQEAIMSRTVSFFETNEELVRKYFAKQIADNGEQALFAGSITVRPQVQCPSPQLLNRLIREVQSEDVSASVDEMLEMFNKTEKENDNE